VKNQTNTQQNKVNGQAITKTSAQLIRIKPSRFLLTIVTLLHVLIAMSFSSSSLPLIWAQIPIVLLCIHLGFYWYCWRLLPTYRLQYLAERWHLLKKQKSIGIDNLAAKEEARLSIKACYYWSRCLVVLIVEDEDLKSSPQYIPIVFDCCNKDDFRFIKVMSKSMLAA
jgi:hypothetical protein